MKDSISKPNSMFRTYVIRLIIRILIFSLCIVLYIFRKDFFVSIITWNFFKSFTPLHVVWAILMLGMIAHLLPKVHITMSGLKSRAYSYREPEGGYDKLSLLEYVQEMNIRAWKVLLIWLCFNAIFGILYVTDVIGPVALIMLTLFYYTCDTVCMVLFCPFQKYIMGNRCCVNCRIFDWGHMMMYTPMLFIPSFFSWSLLFTSLIVMLRWEISYTMHPERFWRGSNATIRCDNCNDKICKIKKPIVTEIDKITSSMPRPVHRLSSNAEELEKEFEE